MEKGRKEEDLCRAARATKEQHVRQKHRTNNDNNEDRRTKTSTIKLPRARNRSEYQSITGFAPYRIVSPPMITHSFYLQHLLIVSFPFPLYLKVSERILCPLLYDKGKYFKRPAP
jgi:hypothetical protein